MPPIAMLGRLLLYLLYPLLRTLPRASSIVQNSFISKYSRHTVRLKRLTYVFCRGLPGVDILQTDAVLVRLLLHRVPDELGTIVTANCLWLSTPFD